MAPIPTTYLVTGANRGLGRGLVQAYLLAPGNTVIATVRDINHPTASSLRQLAKGPGSSLIIIQMDSGSSKSITDAINEIKVSHGVQNLDVVIANAGMAEAGRVTDTPLSSIQKHIDVNTYGPLELFKAALPLLCQSTQPKFCAISTIASSVTAMITALPTGTYGASKALLNYFVRWLAAENENIVTWVVHPGLVATEMGNNAVEQFANTGVELKPISIDESVGGIIKVIAEASKDKTSGHFLAYDGAELPW